MAEDIQQNGETLNIVSLGFGCVNPHLWTNMRKTEPIIQKEQLRDS